MKIAFVVPIVAPYRITFFEKLSKKINSVDSEICVFHGIKNTQDGRPAFEGSLNFKNKTFLLQKKKIHTIGFVWNQGLFSKLSNMNPDIIILEGAVGVVSNWIVLIWAKLKRKKIIFWTCGWEPEKSFFLKKIKTFFLKIFFRISDYNIVYSTKAKFYLVNIGVKENKIEIAYNGIETDVAPVLLKRSDDSELKRFNDKFVYLYVGGIFSDKKLKLLIQAFLNNFTNNHETQLWIVGDGPDLNEFIKKYNKYNNITFFGRRANDVNKFFKLADIFVLPGVGGLALNQSMMWGTPPIVSEADGTEDDLVFHNKTGFRFISNDLISLSNEMLRVREIPKEEMVKISKSAKELILSRSNVNQMVNTFIDVLTKLK